MKVAVIIPALNEEETIGGVLGVVKRVEIIDEIIVVNDGSSDRTSEIAKAHDVTVLDLPFNRGKGGALLAGVGLSSAPVLVFLDADLLNLTIEHIEKLLEPVLKKEKAMSMGLIDRGDFLRISADFMINHNLRLPSLTGQRAILRSVFLKIPKQDLESYGVEVAMNHFCKEQNLPVSFVHLEGLSHVIKEKKMGFWKGLKARIKMFINIFLSFIKIRL